MGASIARRPVSFNEATTRRRLERIVSAQPVVSAMHLQAALF